MADVTDPDDDAAQPSEHPLIAQLRAAGKLPAKPKPQQRPIRPVDPGGAPEYVLAGLNNELAILATTPEGQRNWQLNTSAFKVARFVRDGHLPYLQVYQQLEDVALNIGLTAEETKATLDSAFKGADKHDLHTVIPEREAIPDAYQLDPTVQGEPDGLPQFDDPNDVRTTDPQGILDTLIDQQARLQYVKLMASDAAKARIAAERAAAQNQQQPPVIVLDNFLEVEDPPLVYRIDDNWPIGGNVLLAAQQKAGKTSLIANLIRALVDGERFLDKWEVQQTDHLVLIDNELDERMLRRWLREQGIQNAKAVRVISAKGRLSTFNILEPNTRAQWAEKLHGAEVAIFDPLRPALDALGLSEDKEAGRFLQAWDELKREAGISETIVVHHMGHNGDRSRGDSRLVDWADVNWKIRKESQKQADDDEFTPLDDGGQRFYTAHGRDVYVPEGLLQWDPKERRIRFVGATAGAAVVVDPLKHESSIALEIIYRATPEGGINYTDLKLEMMNQYAIKEWKAKEVIKKMKETPGVNIAKTGNFDYYSFSGG